MTDHTLGVDDGHGPISEPGLVVENPERLRHAAMRPEVSQQWMIDATHRHGPGPQGELRVDTETQHLGICLFELRQRTVERGSLVGSATSERERKAMQHNPLAAELPQGYVLPGMALQREVGCLGTGLQHLHASMCEKVDNTTDADVNRFPGRYRAPRSTSIQVS